MFLVDLAEDDGAAEETEEVDMETSEKVGNRDGATKVM
jgi:hypothetical protein